MRPERLASADSGPRNRALRLVAFRAAALRTSPTRLETKHASDVVRETLLSFAAISCSRVGPVRFGRPLGPHADQLPARRPLIISVSCTAIDQRPSGRFRSSASVPFPQRLPQLYQYATTAAWPSGASSTFDR